MTFAINGYIPMWLCFITCVLSTILAFEFNHTTPPEERKKPIKVKKYMKNLKDAFVFFDKSRRVKSLFIFNAIFMGIIVGVINLRSSLLNEIGVPEAWFGFIFAFLQVGARITC